MRRARDACWRAAGTEQPNTSAISSNGTLNVSCSTKATPLLGSQPLQHDHAAIRTPSSWITSSNGSAGPSGRVTNGSGSHDPT